MASTPKAGETSAPAEPTPAPAHRDVVDVLRSQQERDRTDRFLIQQCVARRFQRAFPEEHRVLCDARQAVEMQFPVAGGPLSPPHSASRTADLLTAAFWLLETRHGRRAIDDADTGAAIHEMRALPVVAGAASAETLQQFVKTLLLAMRPFTRMAEDLMDRVNYFDYFSLLSMTTRVSGEVLHNSYDSVVDSAIWFVERLAGVESEYQWLHGVRDLADPNLVLSARFAKYEPRVHLEGIGIFDDHRNEVTIQGRPVTGSIYLRVDLSEAPASIDAALAYFRASLMDALLDKYASVADIPGYQQFLTTDFATARHDTNTIVKGKNQVPGTILGLWAWDLTRLGGRTREAACTWIAHTIFGVDDPLRAITVYIRHGRDFDVEAAIGSLERKVRKHLDIVKGWIEGGSSTTATARMEAIDKAVTRQALLRLGTRHSQRASS